MDRHWGSDAHTLSGPKESLWTQRSRYLHLEVTGSVLSVAKGSGGLCTHGDPGPGSGDLRECPMMGTVGTWRFFPYLLSSLKYCLRAGFLYPGTGPHLWTSVQYPLPRTYLHMLGASCARPAGECAAEPVAGGSGSSAGWGAQRQLRSKVSTDDVWHWGACAEVGGSPSWVGKPRQYRQRHSSASMAWAKVQRQHITERVRGTACLLPRAPGGVSGVPRSRDGSVLRDLAWPVACRNVERPWSDLQVRKIIYGCSVQIEKGGETVQSSQSHHS